MNSKKNNQSSTLTLSALALLLANLTLTTGCAQKPWRDPLAEDTATAVSQTIGLMQARDVRCPPCLDTEAKLFFKNRLKTLAVSGYLLMKQPSFVKMVVSNPLGQPLLAISSNGKTFQRVATMDRNYLHGRVQSYGLYHDVPLSIINGDWGAWLTGRMNSRQMEVTDIREDEEHRGVWLTVAYAGQNYREHILIDPDRQLILGRALTNSKDAILANITYSNHRDINGCQQPERIAISDLDYGTEIQLELNDTRKAGECPASQFMLPKPVGYAEQYMP